MTTNTTCRICLSTEGLMKDIFNSSNTGLHNQIYECTNVEIKNLPGLPTCICEVCKSELLISHKFRQKCFKSNMILKTMFPEVFENGDLEKFVESDPGTGECVEISDEDECVEISDEDEDFDEINPTLEHVHSTVEVYYNKKIPKHRTENSYEPKDLLKFRTVKEVNNEQRRESKNMLGDGMNSEETVMEKSKVTDENLITILDETTSTCNDEDFNQETDENSHDFEASSVQLDFVKGEYNVGNNENKIMLECNGDPEENECQANQVVTDENLVRTSEETESIYNDDPIKQEKEKKKKRKYKKGRGKNKVMLGSDFDPGREKYQRNKSMSNKTLKMLEVCMDPEEKECEMNQVVTDENLLRISAETGSIYDDEPIKQELEKEKTRKCKKKSRKNKIMLGSGFDPGREKYREHNSMSNGALKRSDRVRSQRICSINENMTKSSECKESLLTAEKPFKCKLCERWYSSNSALRYHMIVHTRERRFKCELCGKSFTNSRNLDTHRKAHTKNKPYKCEYCEKKFFTVHALTYHIRTHTGEKPYECGMCAKTFAVFGNLKSHARVHTGEKPYKCTICGENFRQRGHLIIHMIKHQTLEVNGH